MNIIVIKRFSAQELRKTLGELPEQDFQYGGRIHEVMEIRNMAEDSINYNDNVQDWLEKMLD